MMRITVHYPLHASEVLMLPKQQGAVLQLTTVKAHAPAPCCQRLRSSVYSQHTHNGAVTK